MVTVVMITNKNSVSHDARINIGRIGKTVLLSSVLDTSFFGMCYGCVLACLSTETSAGPSPHVSKRFFQ